MNPHSATASLIQTACLQYYSFELDDQRLIIESLVKVPDGVRFLTSLHRPPLPDARELIQHCLDLGEFSPRPYLLGQATDDSTIDCVMALYEDCCRRSGLDPTEFLARTYPGWEKREDWNEARWQRIRASAQWQGTTFPVAWTPDGILGLVMSLTGHYRSELATTLASALAG